MQKSTPIGEPKLSGWGVGICVELVKPSKGGLKAQYQGGEVSYFKEIKKKKTEKKKKKRKKKKNNKHCAKKTKNKKKKKKKAKNPTPRHPHEKN